MSGRNYPEVAAPRTRDHRLIGNIHQRMGRSFHGRTFQFLYAYGLDRRLDPWDQTCKAMKKIIVPILCAALSGTAVAQTVGDSITDGSGPSFEAGDTAATAPDTTRYTTFGSMAESSPPSAAARAREQRASARSSSSPTASSSSGSSSARRAGKGVKHTNEGPELNLQRALDPEGRKHWQRMNRRSTRQAKGSPPGTVPVQ